MSDNVALQPKGREDEKNNDIKAKPVERIEYWDSYYSKNGAPTVQSSFAENCLPLIKKDAKLLELGCGNGRDAFFFARNGIDVWACDFSPVAISKNQKKVAKDLESRLKFINMDFTAFTKDEFDIPFSIIYSRFSLHVVDNNSTSGVLNMSYDLLTNDGLLLIEARSTKDPLCKSPRGRMIAKNTFVYEKGHVRHFIDKEELVADLTKLGFTTEQIIESDNLSICGDDNPVLIRVVARKA